MVYITIMYHSNELGECKKFHDIITRAYYIYIDHRSSLISTIEIGIDESLCSSWRELVISLPRTWGQHSIGKIKLDIGIQMFQSERLLHDTNNNGFSSSVARNSPPNLDSSRDYSLLLLQQQRPFLSSRDSWHRLLSSRILYILYIYILLDTFVHAFTRAPSRRQLDTSSSNRSSRFIDDEYIINVRLIRDEA